MRVAIVGCGVAGSFLSLQLGRLGHDVVVLEKGLAPEVMRKGRPDDGRHIGVLLNARGIYHLRKWVTSNELSQVSRPLQGRCVHPHLNSVISQKLSTANTFEVWDKKHLALDREALVQLLVQKSTHLSNVQFLFNHKVERLRPLSGGIIRLRATPFSFAKNDQQMSFQDESFEGEFDLVVGCDGVGSVVRDHIHSAERDFHYTTLCDTHCYKSLVLVPSSGNKSMDLSPDYIHTWPRGDVLLHAMPGISSTNETYFNCTLIVPRDLSSCSAASSRFAERGLRPLTLTMLNDVARREGKWRDGKEEVRHLFAKYFPEVYCHGGNAIYDSAVNSVSGYLKIGQCSRLHSSTSPIVLVGDAAHPVLPYIGQGLVSTLEDCNVLVDLFQEGSNAKMAISSDICHRFTLERKKDIDAMQCLSIEQHNILFEQSASMALQLRFAYQRYMSRVMPHRYPSSLYTLLADPSFSYSEILDLKRKQNHPFKIGRL